MVDQLDDAEPREFCWHFPTTLLGAEERALDIGDYHGRYQHPDPGTAIVHPQNGMRVITDLDEALGTLSELLSGATLLGACVHFDAAFITELLRKGGKPADWHHRFLDIGSFAGGAWGDNKPLSTNALSDRIPNYGAHNALEDARWNVEVYRHIIMDH